MLCGIRCDRTCHRIYEKYYGIEGNIIGILVFQYGIFHRCLGLKQYNY